MSSTRNNRSAASASEFKNDVDVASRGSIAAR